MVYTVTTIGAERVGWFVWAETAEDAARWMGVRQDRLSAIPLPADAASLALANPGQVFSVRPSTPPVYIQIGQHPFSPPAQPQADKEGA